MKYLILLFTSFLALFSIQPDRVSPSIFNHGYFDGMYVSYHDNGSKKAEGTFSKNQKKGIWTVWDSEGKVLTKREYKNSFQFNILKSNSTTELTLDHPQRDQYSLTKNKDGFITYPNLKESNILWLQRIWRVIEPSELNTSFFENNLLFKVLLSGIKAKQIIAYSPSTDEFKSELSSDEINKLFQSENLYPQAYKLKEEVFYNSAMQMMETRILGICPVTEEGKDLFWLYFPHIRPLLAQRSNSVNPATGSDLNFEELFFYRQFNSDIYKVSNSKNNYISDYKQGDEIQKEVERIEMLLLKREIESWIKK